MLTKGTWPTKLKLPAAAYTAIKSAPAPGILPTKLINPVAGSTVTSPTPCTTGTFPSKLTTPTVGLMSLMTSILAIFPSNCNKPVLGSAVPKARPYCLQIQLILLTE